ncbi:hypothetical protein [Acetivibrio mesophilus]|uniref:Lipoprotein n=1 Tax=Acetivibrio mesophilus TaxID=2487273 RepID=A0A4Q0I3W2_9FIRM|nr:hypothetical protein [Acetivibrio mesophilus]ODM24914.1 hypothetical protein A7W90_01065 [Clostridium sp. Bc-iso-3]RXE57582.1 hypothetical protein EFD62_16940 [Acetivibrio mesophilus]HHV30097.1 hypothetical protein [Clostridium sp.]
MIRVKLIFVAVIICAVFLLSACGGSGEVNNQPSNSPKVNSGKSTHEPGDEKEKTNAEKFLEYVIEAAYMRKFTETGDYAGIMNTLHDLYKDDIVNPYTGGKLLTIANRTNDLICDKQWKASEVSGVNCIVIDDYMTLLEKIDTSEAVYCLNTESKGCVIGIILMDGVYIYEVDENGEKTNEIKHFFKKEE